jgi:hypothetical protein
MLLSAGATLALAGPALGDVAWGPARPLSEPGVVPTFSIPVMPGQPVEPIHSLPLVSPQSQPWVVVDDAGDALAVWMRRLDQSHSVIEWASRPAGGTWSPAQPLSRADGYSTLAQVVADRDGTATAVWNTTVTDAATGHITETFLLASRAAGGGWSAPVDLSPPGSPSTRRMDVNARGDALAAWTEPVAALPGRYLVRAAVRPAGGAWSPPQELSDAYGTSDLRVRVQPDGVAVVAWLSFVGADTGVQAASHAPGRGWSATALLAGQGALARDLVLAAGPQGGTVATWSYVQTNPLPGTQNDQMATLGGDGSWSASVLPTTSRDIRLRFNARGDAALVWLMPNLLDFGRIEGALRPVGGAWSAPGALPVDTASWFSAELTPQGEAVAIWTHAAPTHDCGPIRGRLSWTSVATLTSAGWSPVQPLNAPGCGRSSFRPPQLAVDAAGDALAVFEWEDNGGGMQVQAVDRPAGGAWSPTRLLSDDAQSADDRPRIALESGGDAVVIWVRYGITSYTIQSADVTFNAPAQVDAPATSSPASSPGALVPSAPQIAPPASTSVSSISAGPPPDRTAPVVLAAMAARVLRLATAQERPAHHRARPLVRVRVRARDNATGIARMQFARNRGRPAAPRAFESPVMLPLRALPRWVRVRDGAGNSSRWVAVRLIR